MEFITTQAIVAEVAKDRRFSAQDLSATASFLSSYDLALDGRRDGGFHLSQYSALPLTMDGHPILQNSSKRAVITNAMALLFRAQPKSDGPSIAERTIVTVLKWSLLGLFMVSGCEEHRDPPKRVKDCAECPPDTSCDWTDQNDFICCPSNESYAGEGLCCPSDYEAVCENIREERGTPPYYTCYCEDPNADGHQWDR